MRVSFDRFTFDSETRELLLDDARVHISPKAFDLLRLLLERRPTVVSKIELHDRIWPGAFVGDANLTVVVAEIRQVLGDDSKEARYIRTVHRVGYAFSGTVAEASSRTGASPQRGYRRCWLVWNEQTFTLAAGENVIGRDPRCGVWVDVSGVSRRHARIDVAADTVTIEDLGSSNGTFIGGERVSAARALRDRDEIDLGAATMTFRAWSDDAETKTERIARR